MSWDLTLYKFAEHPFAKDIDIGELERLSLGSVAEVRDLISKQLPEVEWEAYYTGYFLGEDYRLDFFLGSYDSDEEDVIDHLDISIHGLFSDAVIDVLLRLATPFGWTIQEMMEGQFILPNEGKS
jgi:hypothetical protein